MNNNPLRDEDLKIEILKFIDNFTINFPKKNLTVQEICSYFQKTNNIKSDKIEFNLNELIVDRCIKSIPNLLNNQFVYVYEISPKGRLVLNPESKFIGDIQIKNILETLKVHIENSNLSSTEKQNWLTKIKDGALNSLIPVMVETFKEIGTRNLFIL